jgi:hypothetical protein
MDAGMIRRWSGLVVAGGLLAGPVSGIAQDRTSLTDAQVESNVLRALASAPELSTQNVQSATGYGTVTLTGNVHDEALRTKAENLVARAEGVKKVVDELTLGDTPATTAYADTSIPPDRQSQDAAAMGQQPEAAQANAPVLQSDGAYAPAPDGSGAQPQQPMDARNGQAGALPQPDYPSGNQSGHPGNMEPGYAQPGSGPAGQYAQKGYAEPGYGQPGNGQPVQPGYRQAGSPPSGRQPIGENYAPPISVPGGQQAGLPVTVPVGSMLRIRINRGLDSNHIQPGARFDGTVLTDVVAGGAVAIPRGATVQGTVLDAKKAGVFKGEGELALQIENVTLGGNVYPLPTQVWQREGGSKTAGTVNSALGLGVLGAIVGGVAGGGAGAAVGAGIGGAAGVAGSAATPRGQIVIPPESVLSFTTAQPVTVRTVSEAEMARLSYAAGPGQRPPAPVRRYYSPYYGYYYGPAY